MSIHVKSSEEAQARLAAQKRNSTISSAVIALFSLMLVGLALGYFFLPEIVRESATIVTYKGTERKDDAPDPEKVKTAIQRKPTAPAASQVKVIATANASVTSIPVPDIAVDTQSAAFGDGDDFGGGWGDDIGIGTGGGAKFFDQEVKAERIAFVIDYSGSMSGEREKLMRAELTKSLSGLSVGTKYQLVFFSGPVWLAGDNVVMENNGGGNKKGSSVVTTPGGETFDWSGKGAHEWKPRGSRQEIGWLDVSEETLKASKEHVKKTKLVYGTDWENPLEMAMAMSPPPQVIFFMTDGAMGGRDMMRLTRSLASKANRSDIVVNSVALMEPKAEEPMAELAFKTGGQFTIVEKGGKVRLVKPGEK